jgi:hypothetical protein
VLLALPALALVAHPALALDQEFLDGVGLDDGEDATFLGGEGEHFPSGARGRAR